MLSHINLLGSAGVLKCLTYSSANSAAPFGCLRSAMEQHNADNPDCADLSDL